MRSSRKAHSSGLFKGDDPEAMASEYMSILWGDLQISLLLKLREAPDPAEAQRRAQHATKVVFQLHPLR